MSNELTTISENPGAAGAGSATGEGQATGADQVGIASPSGGAGRKAEIERVMREDFDLYESSGMAAEYRSLIEAEIETANPDAGTPTEPTPADVARVSLCGSQAGQALVYSWERMGGFRTHLEHVQKDVGEIVRAVGDNRAQRAFMETFSRSVPLAAEIAMMDEIATGAPTWVPPASQSEVDLFATMPAGKEMVREWGSDAPVKVAALRKRAARINESMHEDDAADFWAWFEELGTPTVMKIYRKMVGG
jgi:hypothetical protein